MKICVPNLEIKNMGKWVAIKEKINKQKLQGEKVGLMIKSQVNENDTMIQVQKIITVKNLLKK